jgi:putative zinc finger/helix-turn-helix YgiT family protein
VEQICPSCGSSGAMISQKDETFSYGSGAELVSLTACVDVLSCSSCSESFVFGDAELSRHDAICRHLNRLTSSEIRAIRNGYGLSQDQFAQRTGLGSASIQRWESGSSIQQLSSDNLLKLLTYKDNFARLSPPASAKVKLRRGQFRSAFVSEDFERAESFRL